MMRSTASVSRFRSWLRPSEDVQVLQRIDYRGAHLAAHDLFAPDRARGRLGGEHAVRVVEGDAAAGCRRPR
ncbi:hypothetical protein [Sinosporangium siamense]|uniref:hypothetical protein n=1 Tax=Sinosporangium siamense TaxID=1367973 RepID=UPI0019518E05|nr:hypothetical protein [Sinosporangium siamense]